MLSYFHKTFSLYESIFECLKRDEAFYIRANPLRHPLIFYYGHTAVFFINKLNVAQCITERIDPRLESTLAIGVDEMSWDDLDERHYQWPRVAAVKAYRDQVRNRVDRFIREVDFSMPIDWESPLWVILMGIEHERIHLETTSVLIRELPLKWVRSHPVWGNRCRETGPAPQNELLPVEGGPLVLGKNRDNAFYGWDNEYGQQAFDVKPFKASRYLVSNQEFLAFVTDEGYQHQRHWTEEGWAWVQFRRAEHPVFWVKMDEGFRYRTLLAEIDMPWDWPVDINYLEAKAFCNWKSEKTGKVIRMPTEAEWHKLREREASDQPDWERAPGNINLEGDMSACPVTRHECAGGFFDLIGNVWQWTETPIDGFDGFAVHPIYDDFSTPTFDGKHNVFKGGCWISTGNYAIKDSRYAFRRHFFQHAGLRYVEGERLPDAEMKIYETDLSITSSIEAHYGRNDDRNGEHLFRGEALAGRSNFSVVCAQACLEHVQDRKTRRALDVGCAAGRSAFELAARFDHVDAIDFSARLIAAPSHLQETGVQRYVVRDEGELLIFKEVRLRDFKHYEAVKDKISFMQADACNLSEKFSDYDLVFAGNVLEHLYDPVQFLCQIKNRIHPGGLLILVSTYNWQAHITPREKWLGGFKAATGESFTTLDGIREALLPEFERIGALCDLPFWERHSSRDGRCGVAQMSVWERKKRR
ncbi:MAG: 5-histidylcysteine sulfoxide synthase [Gammaproteobacteria bacterium]